MFTADKAVYGSKTFVLTVGKWGQGNGYGFNSQFPEVHHFGSVNDDLPNGFKIDALYEYSGTLFVATTPKLSSLSAIVFGDNESAVTSFSFGGGLFGSSYGGKIPTATQTWLKNHGWNTVGTQIQVTIYANDLF